MEEQHAHNESESDAWCGGALGRDEDRGPGCGVGELVNFLCVSDDVGMDLRINETDSFSAYNTTTVMCTIKGCSRIHPATFVSGETFVMMDPLRWPLRGETFLPSKKGYITSNHITEAHSLIITSHHTYISHSLPSHPSNKIPISSSPKPLTPSPRNPHPESPKHI